MSLVFNINGLNVDYGKPEDLRLAFNYSIADIKLINSSATQGSRSYEITLPATANNKKIFGFTEDVNVTNGFDHTKEFNCFVEFDGSKVIKGTARVKTVLNKDSSIGKYSVVVLGDNATWIQGFRANSLTQVDFTDQNHVYSKAVIDASETLADTRHYIYPLINYGNLTGGGVSINDRFPAIRAKEYLIRMFKAQGYKLQSDFVDTDFFKRLFIPFSGKNFDEVIDNQFRIDRLFRAEYAALSNLVVFGGNSRVVNFDNESTGGNFDNGGHYSGGVYTVDAFSTQEFVFNFDYRITLKKTIIKTAPGAGEISNKETVEDSFDYSFTTVKLQRNTGAGWFTQTSASNVTPADNITTGLLNVAPGEQFRCVVETKAAAPLIRITSAFVETTFREFRTILEPNDGNIFYNNVARYYAPGATVSLNNYIPDINQLDFFTDLRDLFNWHILTDFDRKIVYIEPRDDFFKGTAIDWTNKLNLDRGVNVGFMGGDISKALTLKYVDDDSDAILKKFKEDNERSFSSKTVDILNVNSKDGEGFKSLKVFSSTSMNTVPDNGFVNTELPTLIDDLENPTFKTSYKPRILYYEGVVSLTNRQIWKFEGQIRRSYPKLTFGDTNKSGAPYMGYDDNQIIGLFEKYHKNVYRTINNSRIVNAEFYLTAADIEAFDFRNPVFIDLAGDVTYYHVNKIINYNPLGSGLTKVELIKVINPVPQALENIQVATQPPQEIPEPVIVSGVKVSIGGVTTDVKFAGRKGRTKIVKF